VVTYLVALLVHILTRQLENFSRFKLSVFIVFLHGKLLIINKKMEWLNIDQSMFL